MNTPPPPNSAITPDYVSIAIGELKTDVKHILDGVNEIKSTVEGHGAQISQVKADLAVLGEQVANIRETAKDAAQRKPPWTAIGAFIVALVAAGKGFLFP